MFEVFCIGLAFVFGLLVRQIGLPPLVGFLAAGFGLNWLGQTFGVLPQYTGEVLQHIAHLGVLLLLFTVGLKLKLRQLGQVAVLGGGIAHFGLSVALFTPVIYWLAELTLQVALLVAVALSFSSTVLAAKILESKRQLTAFHGRVAIGILIVQDLIALLVLSVFGGQSPSIWALLVFAVPLLRPVIYRSIDLCGHDEMLVLIGMLLAVVVGGSGFEALGLSSELGALVMGFLLAEHRRARDVAESLWGLKELFLVGFFLQIGMSGLPTWQDWAFALLLSLALPLKGLLFFVILTGFHLRARNAFMGAVSLTAYSEFGLIVAAGVPALNDWIVPLALTVALSFTVAAPLSRAAPSLAERFDRHLSRFQRTTSHPDEVPPDLGAAHCLVIGMGRTGTAAYDCLLSHDADCIGIDADPYRVAEHIDAGRNVVFTDAEDADFWQSVDLKALQTVILAMDDREAKLIAARQLRARGFLGAIIAQALYNEDVAAIREAGADQTHLTMHEAGLSLAEHALDAMQPDKGVRDWI